MLWWIQGNSIPTLPAAAAKPDLLRDVGPTFEAFTFKETYPAPIMLSDDADGESDNPSEDAADPESFDKRLREPDLAWEDVVTNLTQRAKK